MAPTTPQGVPSRVTAGDTWSWLASFRDYQPTEGAGTWTLSYGIVGVDLLEWDPAWAVEQAGGWLVTIPAASTDSVTAGAYRWTATLEGGGTYAGLRMTPARGILTVDPDPAGLVAGDGQSFAEKNLAVVEAALSGRLSSDLQSYSIGGRSVALIPYAELYQIRNKLRTEVWRDRNPGKALPGLHIAFRQPGSSA